MEVSNVSSAHIFSMFGYQNWVSVLSQMFINSFSKIDTVVTFFPGRWGRNGDDNSDVHRRLRIRLKAVNQQEVHSAFDLAIIIIDQYE